MKMPHSSIIPDITTCYGKIQLQIEKTVQVVVHLTSHGSQTLAQSSHT